MILFKFSNYLLIFLVVLPIIESNVFKSPKAFVEFYISPFNYALFLFHVF